jgi:hypothetical protein
MLFAGFVATVAILDWPAPPLQILFLTASVYASFVGVSLAGCVCFWLLWWKPDSWLNSRIPKSVGVFTIFVLINIALAFGYLYTLVVYGASPISASAGNLILGIFFILELAVSAYCVAAFYSRFGAAAKPPRAVVRHRSAPPLRHRRGVDFGVARSTDRCRATSVYALK